MPFKNPPGFKKKAEISGLPCARGLRESPTGAKTSISPREKRRSRSGTGCCSEPAPACPPL